MNAQDPRTLCRNPKSPAKHFLISCLFPIAKHHKQCQQCKKHQITPQVILRGWGESPNQYGTGTSGRVKVTNSRGPCLGQALGGALGLTGGDPKTRQRGLEQSRPGSCSPGRSRCSRGFGPTVACSLLLRGPHSPDRAGREGSAHLSPNPQGT